MWIITKDLIPLSGGEENVDRTGCHSRDYNDEIFDALDTIPIRLLDDDGNVYYEGRATRKRILESSEVYAFEPLDWAMADAGCTELQYYENGVWETL